MCGMNTMPKIMGGLGVDEADKKQALPNKDLFYPTPKIHRHSWSRYGVRISFLFPVLFLAASLCCAKETKKRSLGGAFFVRVLESSGKSAGSKALDLVLIPVAENLPQICHQCFLSTKIPPRRAKALGPKSHDTFVVDFFTRGPGRRRNAEHLLLLHDRICLKPDPPPPPNPSLVPPLGLLLLL
jgi:hypothetical protein